LSWNVLSESVFIIVLTHYTAKSLDYAVSGIPFENAYLGRLMYANLLTPSPEKKKSSNLHFLNPKVTHNISMVCKKRWVFNAQLRSTFSFFFFF
jgi:hypothetical protein